jgi:2-dehydro-3-deoxygluconokinase
VAGPEVVTLGECLVALVASEPGPLAEASRFRRYVAGAEANVAVGLARLGHSAAFIGRVGADGFGAAIVRRLRGEGVDVTGVTVDGAAPTALMIRERRRIGPAEVAYYRSGSAGSRLSPADVDACADAGLLARARWLHVTGITPALSASGRAATSRAVELASAAGMRVSLDLNLRRKLWSDEEAAPILRELAGHADVILGDADEVAAVLSRRPGNDPPALAAGLLALGPSTAVVKLGARGAIAVTGDGREAARPALPVGDPVDPVGAGDAFTAGWISAQLDGADLGESLEVANACGAASVATEGDMTGAPTRFELERLRAAGGRDTIR